MKGLPRGRWLIFALAAGSAAGLGGYTFFYARGASYLTDDAAACANCHVMNEQYDGWLRGSHRAAATCNDCHTPAFLPAKFYVKARNGWHHSWAFTSGRFPQAIQITPWNRRITQAACRRCHGEIVAAIDRGPPPQPLDCIPCHRSTGHLH